MSPSTRKLGLRLAVVLLIGMTLGCDRITKRMAAVTLADSPPRSFLGDTVRLEYAENPGAFLSFGAAWPPPVRTALFTIGNAALLLAVLAAAIKLRWSGHAPVGLSLLMAGGVSNLADRILHGTVVDFLNVGLGPVRTGIFNVADVAIMCGGLLIAVAGFRAVSAADAPRSL